MVGVIGGLMWMWCVGQYGEFWETEVKGLM